MEDGIQTPLTPVEDGIQTPPTPADERGRWHWSSFLHFLLVETLPVTLLLYTTYQVWIKTITVLKKRQFGVGYLNECFQGAAVSYMWGFADPMEWTCNITTDVTGVDYYDSVDVLPEVIHPNNATSQTLMVWTEPHPWAIKVAIHSIPLLAACLLLYSWFEFFKVRAWDYRKGEYVFMCLTLENKRPYTIMTYAIMILLALEIVGMGAREAILNPVSFNEQPWWEVKMEIVALFLSLRAVQVPEKPGWADELDMNAGENLDLRRLRFERPGLQHLRNCNLVELSGFFQTNDSLIGRMSSALVQASLSSSEKDGKALRDLFPRETDMRRIRRRFIFVVDDSAA